MTKPLTPEVKANNKRLRDRDKLIAHRIPKHPRFRQIQCVVGVIDSYGAVEGVIVFYDKNGEDEQSVYHYDHFPKPRYKPWRWWPHKGLDKSCLATVQPDDDDWHKIHDWLYKRGCLNDWEL